MHPFSDRDELAAAIRERLDEETPMIPLTLAEIAAAVGGTLHDADGTSW